MEDKLTKQTECDGHYMKEWLEFHNRKPCDSHCYKEWYLYNKVLDHNRCEELDALYAMDLLSDCQCNKISCSFVNEAPILRYHTPDQTFTR